LRSGEGTSHRSSKGGDGKEKFFHAFLITGLEQRGAVRGGGQVRTGVVWKDQYSMDPYHSKNLGLVNVG